MLSCPVQLRGIGIQLSDVREDSAAPDVLFRAFILPTAPHVCGGGVSSWEPTGSLFLPAPGPSLVEMIVQGTDRGQREGGGIPPTSFPSPATCFGGRGLPLRGSLPKALEPDLRALWRPGPTPAVRPEGTAPPVASDQRVAL